VQGAVRLRVRSGSTRIVHVTGRMPAPPDRANDVFR
jgi:hypothetical protein